VRQDRSIANVVQEIRFSDVHLLALDGKELLSEVHCDRCRGTLNSIPGNSVASETGGESAGDVLQRHRDIYHQRGWRRVEAMVLCPNCINDMHAVGR